MLWLLLVLLVAGISGMAWRISAMTAAMIYAFLYFAWYKYLWDQVKQLWVEARGGWRSMANNATSSDKTHDDNNTGRVEHRTPAAKDQLARVKFENNTSLSNS